MLKSFRNLASIAETPARNAERRLRGGDAGLLDRGFTGVPGARELGGFATLVPVDDAPSSPSIGTVPTAGRIFCKGKHVQSHASSSMAFGLLSCTMCS
jgi:hypothetical protein